MAYFDHFATSGSTAIGDWITRRTVDREFRFFSRFLPAHRNIPVLEIGPGHGEVASRFLNAGYCNYDIVEPNELMRSQLQELGVRSAKSYSIPDLQESSESYDAIIIRDVFEHLNDAREAQRFVSEAQRVLRPGGTLFIASPDLMDWQEDFYNCDFSHSNPTTVRRAHELFINAGLRTVGFSYSYGCLGGLPGYFLSRCIKLLTSWTNGEDLDFKPYKLRLTFLRRFLIAGTKMPT